MDNELISVIGIIVSLFLNNKVGEVSITENIQLIFWLYLSDTVMSYLFTYKRSILYANQQNYYINIADIFYNILMNATEILYLLMFRNFIGYLIIKILFRLAENIFISIIADKKYPYICKNIWFGRSVYRNYNKYNDCLFLYLSKIRI